jgi:hypothetical protein
MSPSTLASVSTEPVCPEAAQFSLVDNRMVRVETQFAFTMSKHTSISKVAESTCIMSTKLCLLLVLLFSRRAVHHDLRSRRIHFAAAETTSDAVWRLRQIVLLVAVHRNMGLKQGFQQVDVPNGAESIKGSLESGPPFAI